MDRQENRQTDELMDDPWMHFTRTVEDGQKDKIQGRFRGDKFKHSRLASDICIVTLTAKKKASYIQFV